MASKLLNFANSGRSDFTSSPHSRGFADMSLFVARRLGLITTLVIAVGACSMESSAAPPADVENAATPAATQSQVAAAPGTVAQVLERQGILASG